VAGRPRVATRVLEMRDAFTKHPERRRERENEPKGLPGLGECPPELGDLVVKAWEEIVKSAPSGVLTAADAISVKIAAILLAALNCGELGDKGRAQLIALLGKFGMNPSDRSRVAVVKIEKGEHKREKYLA
jgi:hypothetical protein